MARKVFRSGNSTVVSIPPELLERLDLEPGDEVRVEADADRRRIVVTPLKDARSGASPEAGERLGELIKRYAPALERLMEMEEGESEAAQREIDAEALERARGLRAAFAAKHGVLTADLVASARKQREAQAGQALGSQQEGEDREPRR